MSSTAIGKAGKSELSALSGVLIALLCQQTPAYADSNPAVAAIASTSSPAAWNGSAAPHSTRAGRTHKGKRSGKDQGSTLAAKSKGKGKGKGKGTNGKGHSKGKRAGGGAGAVACRETVSEGKQLVVRGALVEARDLLESCAKPTCGKRIEGACKLMRSRLANDIPTVVFAVEGGSPDTDIEVTMDDKPLSAKLDGRSVPVNPGNHEFVFSSNGATVANQAALIVEGQHNRVLSVNVSSSKKRAAPAVAEAASEATESESAKEEPSKKEEASKVAAAESAEAGEEDEEATESKPVRKHQDEANESGHSSWPTYALAGVGVAALGTAGLFTYWGLKDNKDLGEMCAPDCNPDSVRHIRNLYLTADIAAGVGVVALVAATWMALSSTDESGKPASKEVARIRRFDFQPTRAGGIASVGGTF